jgi:hypothetical protein
MNRVVLDDIPFHIELNRLLKSLSIKADSLFASQLLELVETATAIGRPNDVTRQIHIGDSLLLSHEIRQLPALSGNEMSFPRGSL